MFLQVGEGSSAMFFRVLDMNRYARQAVMSSDGADLLYVRHVLGFAMVLSPGGMPRQVSAINLSAETKAVMLGDDRTRDTLLSQPRGVPDPANGNTGGVNDSRLPSPAFESDLSDFSGLTADQKFSGPQTDREISWRLLTPRQRIILWVYDRQSGLPRRWLESPRPNMTTDATVGPTPISCDVVAASGEPESVGIFYQFQTDVLPCPVGSDRLVLSHRWQMEHRPDDNFYLTRAIDGEIVFNGAYIHTFNTNPDLVRNQFLHPVPVGFRRRPPVVTQSSDGLTIRYHVEDYDPSITFSPGDSGATQIQIMEKIALYKPWANVVF